MRGKPFWGTGNALGMVEDGTHAELLSVEVGALVPLPAAMTMTEAGAAGLSFSVSSRGLEQAGLGEAPDQVVLVTGAAGGVGAAAADQVAWRGGRVIAAVLDDEEREAVLALHPEAVVATAAEPLAEVVAEATAGRGVDIVYDTVGNALFAESVDSLAVGGRMVVITAVPGAEPVPLDLFGFYRRSAALITANWVFGGPPRSARAWAAVAGIQSGALRAPTIAEEFGLDEAARAYEATQEGRRGRVVLLPNGAEGPR